ncbi:MAG: UDP-N-acetylglucosamine 2-epimerase (non-hydrolyzing), partial [Candidatus Omnitrophica bacterium]|nr:UDP-N-acetylglucosamine 2-epimerase (non-hydrolyzing) [Candidatus Omnitrophota bacterium]
ITAINKHNARLSQKYRPRSQKGRFPRKIDYYLVYTGQHYDRLMSGVFWSDLGLPRPAFDLKVGSASHAAQTANIMAAFEKVALRLRPDIVVVVGDVNSTLASALVSAKLGISVAHVESGLRSFDKSMPEEINRILTDHLSDFLFVTEESALRNLKKEGINKKKVYYVGNVMIDTLIKLKEKTEAYDIHQRLGFDIKRLKCAVLTLHRPSNVDDRAIFKQLADALASLSRYITIIFPVHPRTEKMLKKFGLHDYFSLHNLKPAVSIHENKINCIDPLSYIDFIKLMSAATFVLTDSGGIQEETTILGIPCLTIRENTERPVTIEKGTNILVGCSKKKIIKESKRILDGKMRLKKRSPLRLWDGRAAERIIDILSKAPC